MARRYLGTPERAEFMRSNPRGPSPRLLGRIAAKDAVCLNHCGARVTVPPVEVPWPIPTVHEGVVAVNGGPADGTRRGRGHGVVDRCGRRRGWI